MNHDIINANINSQVNKAWDDFDRMKDIDAQISYAVKEGFLDQDEAESMTYDQKRKFLDAHSID